MDFVGKRVTVFHSDNLNKVNYRGEIIRVKESGLLVILRDNGRISIPDLNTIQVHHTIKKEKTMDKQEAIIKHRAMWQWLSENPNENKLAYIKTCNINPHPHNECFLCEYVLKDGTPNCENCLLVWPKNDIGQVTCDHPGGLWAKWRDAPTTRRSELARQIRDLPEREEEKERLPVSCIHHNKPVCLNPKAIKHFGTVDGVSCSNSVPDSCPEFSKEGFRGLAGMEFHHATTGRISFDRAGIGKSIVSPPPKLTRAEAIAKTREQWGWLAHHPGLGKSDYFKEKEISIWPAFGCYLCEWVIKHTEVITPSPECGEVCPFSWPGGMCEGEDGLHSTWCEAIQDKNYKLATAVAYLIYRLPEKEE